MNDVISEIDCIRVDGDDRQKRRETIAIEAEMQLMVNDKPVTIFLYSAGMDEQLAVGYLLSSGLITGLKDIEKIEVGDRIGKVWISERENQDVSIKDAGISSTANRDSG